MPAAIIACSQCCQCASAFGARPRCQGFPSSPSTAGLNKRTSSTHARPRLHEVRHSWDDLCGARLRARCGLAPHKLTRGSDLLGGLIRRSDLLQNRNPAGALNTPRWALFSSYRSHAEAELQGGVQPSVSAGRHSTVAFRKSARLPCQQLQYRPSLAYNPQPAGPAAGCGHRGWLAVGASFDTRLACVFVLCAGGFRM
jgi:hypothetical protein